MAQARVSFKKQDAERRRLEEIFKILKREYPDAKCSLDFENPFQLLIATILSAQCTDERVNKTTPALFKKYPTPAAMAKAPLKDIEKLVQSTGFYKNKAKSVVETSKALTEKYAEVVPKNLDQLVELRGVGRKTANVILGNAYGIPGFPVDTHVGRLVRRMGFSKSEDPVKIEFEIHDLAPQENWTLLSNLLIWHGRKICSARKPLCEECPVARFCPKIGILK
ncbi:endonuclease III [bacterium]|nr:endonuclease III [bacterium]